MLFFILISLTFALQRRTFCRTSCGCMSCSSGSGFMNKNFMSHGRKFLNTCFSCGSSRPVVQVPKQCDIQCGPTLVPKVYQQCQAVTQTVSAVCSATTATATVSVCPTQTDTSLIPKLSAQPSPTPEIKKEEKIEIKSEEQDSSEVSIEE